MHCLAARVRRNTPGATLTNHPNPSVAYHLVITRKGRRRVWQWQIQRRPPTGNRMHADGFKTEFEARLAGEKALQTLVSRIDGP
jgi:hypothetical protein